MGCQGFPVPSQRVSKSAARVAALAGMTSKLAARNLEAKKPTDEYSKVYRFSVL